MEILESMERKLMEESYTVWVKDKCVSIGFMSYEDAVYLSDWHRENGVADEDIEIEDTGGMELGDLL
jgi:hypothetical protein